MKNRRKNAPGNTPSKSSIMDAIWEQNDRKIVEIEYLPGVLTESGTTEQRWLVWGPFELDSEMCKPLFAKSEEEAEAEAQRRASLYGATIER